VELILDKIIEIPSNEAKKNRELVNLYKDYITKVADKSRSLSEGGKMVAEASMLIVPELKRLAHPDKS
jgi:hypothetical protein